MVTVRASTLRDELLNGEIFTTLREAQVLIESWRRYYNAVRPHSSLGYQPPAVDGNDLYGGGVNIAACLEAEAPAGGILISSMVHEAVSDGRLNAETPSGRRAHCSPSRYAVFTGSERSSSMVNPNCLDQIRPVRVSSWDQRRASWTRRVSCGLIH
jgi:hypothetical protein